MVRIVYPDVSCTILFFLEKNDATLLFLSLIHVAEFCSMRTKIVKSIHF